MMNDRDRRPLVAIAGTTGLLAVSRVIERWVGDSAVPAVSAYEIVQFVAAGFMAATVLVWLAARASGPRSRAMVLLFAIGAIIALVNDIEALVFRIGRPGTIAGLLVIGVGFHALVVAIISRAVPPRSSGDNPDTTSPVNRSPAFWIIRVVSLGALYLVIYVVAGAIIYPFVRDFYAATQLPPRGTVFALQMFVRGPAFVGVGALVVLLIRGSRRMNAVAVAVTLAGLGGLAALIAPNALLPDQVRLVHLGEVGVSNAVFGWVVGWVMTAAIVPRAAKSAERPAQR